ncbi:MAG: glycosyltransferase [Eubacterium sp.]|nr:glycosyltransferase [Eubacterium sp.]
MNKTKVSVVIPTYNRANTIKRAIDSVLNQTYKDFELIIVDDGSTDNTAQIVNEYKDSRLRYLVTEKRRGANHARNIGIQNAVGEYIAFQDSDDVWLEDKLEKQMNVFETRGDVDIVFSRFTYILLNGSTGLIPNRNYTQEMLVKDIAHILSRMNVISTQTMIVRKQCFIQYGAFDLEMPRFQDWEINLRFAQGAKFFCVDESLVEVYESESSITNTKGNGLSGLALLIKKYEDFFRLHGTLQYHLSKVFPMAVKEERLQELERWLGKQLFYESIYADAYRNKSIQFKYSFVKEWIMDGSYEEKINAFFMQHQAKDIILYGYGEMGELLIKKLADKNKTKIRFIIDQNVAQSAGYEIKRLEDVNESNLSGVKCLIITAVAHENEIRTNIQNTLQDSVQVIGVRDIMNSRLEKTNMKFIYGAGKYGKLLLQWMIENGVKIDYFVQTNEPQEKAVDGIPVVSLQDMNDMEANKIIFIAMNNPEVIDEIKKNLYADNGSETMIQVYDCRSFINDNLACLCRTISSGEKQCIICNNNVAGFLPAGSKEKIYEQHYIIGGGYRQNCICPCCQSMDRERWLYYVLKNKTDIFQCDGRVLHFAPEERVAELIKQNKKIDYYTGDVVARRAMHITDITDIQYKDEIFDYVISNHIMEHISEEEKAVSEIKRVLKKDGKWIFSFPICTDMKTYEDENIILPEERLAVYGQEDHVRLYGCDYKERFEKYGLKIQVYSPQDELDREQIEKLGFIKDDIIMIAMKKGS